MDVFGLPLHPLIVHAAVIFVPLAALGALLVVFLPRLRTRYGSLVVIVGVVATLSAFAAMLTGPLLAQDLGIADSARIAAHEALGKWTPWPVLVMAIALPVFLRVRSASKEGQRALGSLTGALTVVGALAALVLIGLTGHAGATAVWG